MNDSVAEKSFELVDGEELYVGKHAIFNGESELRVIPWQSPAARTFFLSSAVEPLGVRRSRTFATTRNRIDDFDDTVFADLLSLVEELQRPEPSFDDALLRDLVRDRTGEMQDIVKTIQGGPGTGKTAIALHRVSYLLFNHEELRNDDVLVVGPTPTFSRYIKSLLPSLGDFDVRQENRGTLGPTPSDRRSEADAVAALKGDSRMTELIARALGVRIRPTSEQAGSLTGNLAVHGDVHDRNCIPARLGSVSVFIDDVLCIPRLIPGKTPGSLIAAPVRPQDCADVSWAARCLRYTCRGVVTRRRRG